MTSHKTIAGLGALALVVGLLGAGVAAGQEGEETSPAAPAMSASDVRDELLVALRPLSFGKDGVERILVEGMFRPLHQQFALHGRGDDEYDLSVSAIEDGEPYLVGRDGVSLTYLPGDVSGRIAVFPGLAQLYMGLADGRLQFAIATVGPDEGEEGRRVIVDLDPASVLRGVTENLRVQREENGRYRLLGASPRGTEAEFDIDPSAAYPLRAMRVTPTGHTEPAIEITRLEINGDAGARAVGIPELAKLREHFDVDDLRKLPDAEPAAQGMRAMLEAVEARAQMAVAAASEEAKDIEKVRLDTLARRALGQLVREAAAK